MTVGYEAALSTSHYADQPFDDPSRHRPTNGSVSLFTVFPYDGNPKQNNNKFPENAKYEKFLENELHNNLKKTICRGYDVDLQKTRHIPRDNTTSPIDSRSPGNLTQQ